jgi:hypothetical protein
MQEKSSRIEEVAFRGRGCKMEGLLYFPRKSLSKYLTDTIDFNKHVHDIDIFINDKWRKYAGGDIGRLIKITRRLELRF